MNKDAREINYLKEMLLEEKGEATSGRERQFRWKNLDTSDVHNENNHRDSADAADNGGGGGSEEENEEEWRKMRYERSLVLEESSICTKKETPLESTNISVKSKRIRKILKNSPAFQADRPFLICKKEKISVNIVIYICSITFNVFNFNFRMSGSHS